MQTICSATDGESVSSMLGVICVEFAGTIIMTGPLPLNTYREYETRMALIAADNIA